MVSEVFVIGMGMGNPGTLTLAARDALGRSELVIGAQRLLDALGQTALCPSARKAALVSAARIAELLRVSDARMASVVMSGDVGFHSGATGLYGFLDDLGGPDGPDVTVVPGISTLAYLCARLRIAWQDVHVVSAHGRACDVAGAVQCHGRTFVLLGGANAAAGVCTELAARGLGEVRVWVGERLSYEDERITCGTAAELAGGSFDALSVLLVENEHPVRPEVVAPHLADAAFERGKVPMTKEEVRELAICKLRVRPSDVVWDVGAGTGSVSVELARAAYAGQVLAVERSAEALGLIARNRERFGTSNLRIVYGEAPAALEGLPAPDRMFVGGSSGRLDAIVRAALAANPRVRLCIAAVTLETLGQAIACIRELGLSDVDVAQVSIAKAREAGAHTLMRAHNPVYLITVSK